MSKRKEVARTGQRRTGQTSRMLEAARSLAEAGDRIVVVAAHSMQADDFRAKLPPSVTVVRIDQTPLLGTRRTTLIDHYATECALARESAAFRRGVEAGIEAANLVICQRCRDEYVLRAINAASVEDKP